ncbi:hypothetical protein L5515_002986 [Caenorhabditis briggsae]|uniref:Uncharacterized protein n=1 Tax=Caenorhabditis briggsae TaxID=6238 RepID=A0AAE9EHT5_CAEBR|nr:hypothetical protein L5515_002986 [Caenorhabditis briggsae]
MGFPKGVQEARFQSFWRLFVVRLYWLFCDHQDRLGPKAIGFTSSPAGATQQRPKDHSLLSARTWIAAAPWMSHQFCSSAGSRLKKTPPFSSFIIDVFTNSKNLGLKAFSRIFRMWTSPGKLLGL